MDAAIRSPDIKNELRDNTNWAIERGVFGVPTIIVADELFWGHDAFEMAIDFMRSPDQFQDLTMRAVEDLPIGASRNPGRAQTS